jgi:hypothetical protein
MCAQNIAKNYKFRQYNGAKSDPIIDHAYFPVQDKAESIGPLDPKSESTWACAKINGRFFAGFTSGAWKTNDDDTYGHAEAHIVHHFANYFDDMVKDGLIDLNQPNSLTLKITKTPCSECAPMITDFLVSMTKRMQKAGSFAIRIKAACLYEGDSSGLKDAYKNLKALNEFSIPVIQWDISSKLQDPKIVATKRLQVHEMHYARKIFGSNGSTFQEDLKQRLDGRMKKFDNPDVTLATIDDYKKTSYSRMREELIQTNETGDERRARCAELMNEQGKQLAAMCTKLKEINVETYWLFKQAKASLARDLLTQSIKLSQSELPEGAKRKFEEIVGETFSEEAIGEFTEIAKNPKVPKDPSSFDGELMKTEGKVVGKAPRSSSVKARELQQKKKWLEFKTTAAFARTTMEAMEVTQTKWFQSVDGVDLKESKDDKSERDGD